MSANWGKPGDQGLRCALSRSFLLTCPQGRHSQGSHPQKEQPLGQLTKKSHPGSVSSKGQTCTISYMVFWETWVQTLAAPRSEQGTRGQGGSSGLLPVFWVLPPRSSLFGSELRLRVAMETWGPKLEKTRMSAHPLPDRNQETLIRLSCRASRREASALCELLPS